MALLLASGFLTLSVAMGVGRFFYTPLLPLMQRAEGFDLDVGGVIASANFAGYLVGSLLMSLVPRGPMRLTLFRVGLAASVATTIGMGLTQDMTAWLVLRALSGVASATAMILAAGMVAEALAARGLEHRMGYFWGGVGLGIAASGLLVRFGQHTLSWQALWIAAGLGAGAVSVFIVAVMRDHSLRPVPAATLAASEPVPRRFPFWPLMFSYLCEGLGYSVFVTFIVALVKLRPGFETLGDMMWVVLGLAAVPACVLWSLFAQRVGYAQALVVAMCAQVFGVLLPVLSHGVGAAFLAAILFGATFNATTFLTMPLGREGAGGRGFALLTAFFGLGQMLGPILAGYAAASIGVEGGLVASAAILGAGALCVVYGIRKG